ncbi:MULTISPECIES: hypothetical protein [Tsukamurella]|uniref:Uncharacterized protein n=2 Tax=Tsukamurella TaxID=2060 RepID=A0A5C5RYU3_9ACTN|nr:MULTISPECIES: hypothetical protein [Tsukamurella]NMD54206.1 hypothetical protein [Tsukamurella columbiensis]TWS28269.1 hypothetical protein FK530_14440 [Tsukamurella conjunctivitidis]
MDPYTPPGSPGMPEPVLVSIGDIHCTRSDVITPAGTFPIAGSQWTVTDHSVTTRAIPTWAIVLAIVGAFVVCLFSLFFLLVKEDRTQGFVQVTVIGPEGRSFTTSVPVYSFAAVQDTFNRVTYARNLAIGM